MSKPFELNHIDTALIALAIEEDFGREGIDPTTALLFSKTQKFVSAHILSKHAELIVFCGLPVINQIIAQLMSAYSEKNALPPCRVTTHFYDGEMVSPGTTCLTISGPASLLLRCERTLLNFLQRLSGIATLTHQFVKRVSHTKTKILDTRKTTPGLRHLAKYAVLCGGGVNHRMGLYDAIMIKDTHVDMLGGMTQAMSMLSPAMDHPLPVIVEVRTQDELKIVLEKGIDKVTRVLLDNMSLDDLKKCVALCEGIFPTEASGNIDLHCVASIAETGVDFISVGKLTHSASSVDLSMRCETV